MKQIPFSPDWNPSLTPSPASQAKPQPTADRLGLPVAAAESMKVIIVDDDPISREIVSSLIRAWGYEMLVTQGGREAMEALRAQTTPTIVLLDWMMPGMDGIEVCRRVREGGKPVYILLLTARGGKEQVVEGLNAGADDYLVKPFDNEELRARVRVGARILELQAALSERVQELERLARENQELKLRIPL